MAVNITADVSIARRAVGGAPGAPAALRSGQPAYNEQDNILYIGVGDDGAGNATSIIGIGGPGLMVTKTALSEALENAGAGDMLKSVYDADSDGKVDAAEAADTVPWTGVQDRPASFPPTPHGHDVATAEAAGFMSATDKAKLNGIAAGANAYAHPTGDGSRHVPATAAGDGGKVLRAAAAAGEAPAWTSLAKADVGLGNVANTAPADLPVSSAQQVALDAKADLASPVFSGAPKAPTAAAGNSTTQIATTAFVSGAIAALVGGAPGALDTLNELAAALGDDPDFAATLTSNLASKLSKSANLSDLPNASAARANLELGSLAEQASDNVHITGGTIVARISGGEV